MKAILAHFIIDLIIQQLVVVTPLSVPKVAGSNQVAHQRIFLF